MLKLTKQQIIKETAEFYNLNNRGYEPGWGCSYLSSDGRMCAVGRCLVNPAEPDNKKIGDEGVTSLIRKLGDNIFKPQYRGHDRSFWSDLQEFHDNETNWNDEGLSVEGDRAYAKLMENYKN